MTNGNEVPQLTNERPYFTGINVFVPNLWVNGLTLWPFVLLKERHNPPWLIRHEAIHLRQQAELLLVPFYLLYLGEYAWYRMRGMRHDKAYRSISFEQEAYKYHNEPDYLKGRKWGACFKS